MEGRTRKQRRDDVRREGWEVQDRSSRNNRKKGKASAKKQREIVETLKIYTGVQRRDMNENVFARPIALRENAETAISCRGPEPARKTKEVYQ